jgi:hypothetical protein
MRPWMRRDDGACGGGDICGTGIAGVYAGADPTGLETGGEGDGDGGTRGDDWAEPGRGVL